MMKDTNSKKNNNSTTGWPFLRLSWWFGRNKDYFEGVPRINIYLLKLLFTLMFFLLSWESWSYILGHKGPWNNAHAAAWCMWGAYSIISFIGIRYPLKMLPIVLFEIIYKIAWLCIVAYPLWQRGELAGSPAAEMTRVYIWVIFPMVAMPWRYLFRNFIWGKPQNEPI